MQVCSLTNSFAFKHILRELRESLLDEGRSFADSKKTDF